MVCPKCHSGNVNTTVVSDVKMKNKHGAGFWIFVGWWWELIKFVVFGWIYLLIRLIVGKKKKIVTKQVTMAVCQNCGYSWRI